MKKINFSYLYLILSIIFFILILYKFRSISFDIIFTSHLRIYFYISFSLIGFSLITFFLKREVKIYLNIIGISFLLTIYIYEFYTHYIKKDFDLRTKLEIYKDMKSENSEISLFYPYQTFIDNNLSQKIYEENEFLFPMSGVSNINTINCNENGKYAIYKSDKFGFNNTDNKIWDKKNIELLLLGDSFIHGACVDQDKTIAYLMNKATNNSTLNLGMSGSSIVSQYAILREYSKNFQNINKIIIFIFEGNDFWEIIKENNSILSKYANETISQNLIVKQDLIDLFYKKKTEIELNKVNEKFYRFIFLKNLRKIIKISEPNIKKPYEKNLKIDQETINIFKAYLKLINEFKNTKNSKITFVYLPEFERYNNINYIDNSKKIKNLIKKFGFNFVNVHEELFKQERNPKKFFPFEKNGHYNEQAYLLISELLIDKIK